MMFNEIPHVLKPLGIFYMNAPSNGEALTGRESMLRAIAPRAAALPGAQAAMVATGEEHSSLVREQTGAGRLRARAGT